MMPEPGGPGGPLAPPIFGRSVNPILTGEGRLSPPITTGTPNVFHLPALLYGSPGNPKVTVHKGAETIQGMKLFKGGNYMRK